MSARCCAIADAAHNDCAIFGSLRTGHCANMPITICRLPNLHDLTVTTTINPYGNVAGAVQGRMARLTLTIRPLAGRPCNRV